ncbi:PP2C family protein-serine/threonine phosphatase [Fusibacter sp. JL298sf-3]
MEILKGLKKYIPSLMVLVAILVFNRMVIFENYMLVGKPYLSKVIFITAILFTLLANASYYSNRAKIEKRFIIFSLLSFVMVTNLFVSLGFVFRGLRVHFYDILFWMSLGRFIFALGYLEASGTSRFVIIFNRISRFIGAVVLIVGVEYILYKIWAYQFAQSLTLLFVLDVGTSVLMLVTVINAFAQMRIDTYIESMVGGGMFLVAQVYFTLMPYKVPNLIQGMLLMSMAVLYFFTYLNKLNSTVPKRESEQLKRQFNMYAKNLKKIIDKKTIQLIEVNDKFMEELAYAKKIQQSLLPENRVMFRDVQIVSGYFPCEQVSGDFYDVYRIDEDNVALYVLDVAGHGISAALMTMFSNNYLKSNEQNLKRYRGMRPDVNLQQFYKEFNKMNFPDEMHMVIFYATLDLSRKVLTYCSGGMNCAPIRIKAKGGYEILEDSSGFAICKLDDFFTPEFKSARVQLESGDRLIFYTDGLVDEEKNGMFNTEALIVFLNRYRHLDIDTVYGLLEDKIKPIKDTLNDDITFVLMEV